MEYWKRVYEEWDKISEEDRRRIRELFLKAPRDKLQKLFEREPYAKKLYEKIAALTPEEIGKLEDLFRATLYRELGRVPRDAMSEFRVWVDSVKYLPFEEASERIKRLAMEIVERERAGVPPIPPAPPAPPGMRRLTGEEVRRLRDRFIIALRERGIRPEKYMAYFRTEVEGRLFTSFEEAERTVDWLVEHISILEERARMVRAVGWPIMRWGVFRPEVGPTEEDVERWLKETEPPAVERWITTEVGEKKIRELDMFKDWLSEAGMTLEDFEKLPEYTKKLLYAAFRRERKLIF
jgi:hypothetical protein